MFANLLNLSLLALALPITTLADYHGNPILNRNPHHRSVARRADGHVDLFKRVSNARWSFYNVETGNAGSCGQFHQNSDFTVAMNIAQMNKGSMCFKTIRMTYGGKTTIATVSDTCPGCPPNGLDLTEGLFAFFAPASVGIIYGTWEFTDAAPAAPPPAPKPTTTWRPTTTWSPPPAPTTTRTPTTSSTPTPTTSSTKASSSSRASSSASSSASAASAALVAPSGIPVIGENLADLVQAFVQLGGVVVAGANI